MTQLQDESILAIPGQLQEGQEWVPAGAEVGKGGKRRRRRRRSRVGEGEARKRKLSEEQVKYLEMRFWEERKLESGRKARLAAELGLDPKQVAVWFQNRRARWKCKHIEEEYVKLKVAHDAIVLDKCHLETEILKLKEQLLEAKEKIEKLSVGCGGGPKVNSSPSTSASVEFQQPFLGEIGAIQQAEQVYMDDYSYFNTWDLFSIYGI